MTTAREIRCSLVFKIAICILRPLGSIPHLLSANKIESNLVQMSRFGINLLGREDPPPGYHTSSENRCINGIGPTPSPEDDVRLIFFILTSRLFTFGLIFPGANHFLQDQIQDFVSKGLRQ